MKIQLMLWMAALPLLAVAQSPVRESSPLAQNRLTAAPETEVSQSFADAFFARPTTDNRYARPMSDVLADLQRRYKVRLNYDARRLKTIDLPYADFRIRPWYDVEQALTAVLAPADYRFVRQAPGVYEIKEFEYAKCTLVEGKEYLDYLSTLYNDKKSFETRRSALQKELRRNAGLEGIPAAPAGKPYLSEKRCYDGYYVQNIGLEILPGVYCTGSIYHPLKSQKGSCPVVLNPNGHFGDGRYRADEQKRCAMQAKMGCIAVSYDLFAWDEQLLQFDSKTHRSAMAHTIQSLNAIRMLDYLLSLKEADKTRVGITGGSGGGSQTMFITAIDDRITLSMPVVMTSCWHNGGCPCESGNPIHQSCGGTNNVELAAMCVPRPMLVVSDGGDWTSNVPQIEFPFIQRIYGFYNAQDKLENAHFPKEGHDYGMSKRQATYRFLEKHWHLNTQGLTSADGSFDESGVTIEDYSLLKVWGKNGENLPANAIHGLDALYELFRSFK